MKDSHLKILKETERISIARNTTPVCKNIAYLQFILHTKLLNLSSQIAQKHLELIWFNLFPFDLT